MTKKEIVRTIADKTGLTQQDVKLVVQLTFEGIIDTLIEEGRVELRNFGVFQVKSRRARKARNPQTGRQVDVPEKYVVTFKPGKMMDDRVNQSDGNAAQAAAEDSDAPSMEEDATQFRLPAGPTPEVEAPRPPQDFT
ncbi:MAG: integration host factor subunit beta [Planctomycetota bacterium]|nr:MAG: integration host factor subunit beta [Planctomycetota bacterium]